MKPNDLYRLNPNTAEWIRLTTECGTRCSGVEFGKFYFASYANMNADDSYPLFMPYAADSDLVTAVSLHTVPQSHYGKAKAIISEWRAALGKKGADEDKLAKQLGQSFKICNRRYESRLFKAIYRISDVDRAYGLWLSLNG